MAVLTELPVDAQVSIRGEPPAGFPVEPNTTATVDGKTVLWLGPDEWLVLGGREADYPHVGGRGRRLGQPRHPRAHGRRCRGRPRAGLLARPASVGLRSRLAARRRCWRARR